MVGGIYKILNIVNNDFYLGSTNCFYKRKYQHFNFLNKGSHPNIHLQRAFNKYGKENFIFERFEIIDEVKNLIIKEQYYLDTLKPRYNIRLIANTNQGLKFGPLSNEHKEKISSKNKLKRRTIEQREHLRQIAKNNPNPKFIYSQLGRIKPQSEKDSISNSMKGKDVSIQCRKACIKARSIPIIQLSLNNEFIKEWDSSTIASLNLGLNHKNINSNLRGKSKSCGGFIWKYKIDFDKINTLISR